VATSPLQPVGTFRIALPSHAWTWSDGLFAILGLDSAVEPTTELMLQHQHLDDHDPFFDQAKGALMFAYGIDEETAFALLREYSQHLNLKVRRDLARDLADAARQPGGWSSGTRNLLDHLMSGLSDVASIENPGA
jgi:hypothetical protein